MPEGKIAPGIHPEGRFVEKKFSQRPGFNIETAGNERAKEASRASRHERAIS